MTPTPTRPLAVGDLLPDLAVALIPEGRRLGLRTESRDARILLLLPADPGPWREWLEGLGAAARDIHHWYASTLVVVAGEEADTKAVVGDAATGLLLAADPGGVIAGALGDSPDASALIIADRYGQVYATWRGATPADLPGPGEVEEWARFLATQCPECGVIDAPSPTLMG